MPKPAKGPRLGGSAAHERLILANLCRSVIEHRQIVTTVTRAKRVQPLLEKLVTKAKRGDMHSQRQIDALLGTNTAKREGRFNYTYELVHNIVPAMDADREGGYTRIVKLPNRKGDQAPMAQLSLVMEKVEKKAVVKTAEATTKQAAKVEAPAEEEAVTEEVVAEETPVEANVAEETAAETEADAAEEAK